MDMVSPLLQWLNAHPQLAGLFTFIISAAESVAIIGTIVPGSIMMTAIGALAGAGVIPLYQTIVWAILGAIVGDGISYWIGHYFKDRLHRLWPFRRYPTILATGERFFFKYGSMSVFIGRFVGPVRALVPMVAGMLGMRPLKFIIANVTSAIGWAPAYMLPGILLGAASQELPPDIAIHVILALFLIMLFLLLCLWFLYKIFRLIHYRTFQMQQSIWQQLEKSRYFSSTMIVLKHHDNTKIYRQLNLVFIFILSVLLFFTLALIVKLKGPANIMINDVVFHLFRGLSIRNDSLSAWMINLTLLGQKQVIFPALIGIFLWLFFIGRKRLSLHVLALGILSAGSVFVLKHLFKIPRPWGIVENSETFSMPSGHTTLAATVYVGLAFFIILFQPGWRRFLYAVSLCLVAAVAISRLYLGAHWFTDIIGAWLISTAILSLVILSYNRKRDIPIQPSYALLMLTLALFGVSYGFYHHYQFKTLQKHYMQISWPRVEASLSQWWDKNDELPAYRTSLIGYPASRLNIEWVGNLETIRKTLAKEGWIKPPARDLVSTLHRIADISSTEYLPLISPQYLDKQPQLTLTRRSINHKSLLVLRIWDSNRTIKENHLPLWVGVLSEVPRSYSWIYKKNTGEIEIDPTLIFPQKTGIGIWQWKLFTVIDEQNPSQRQKIMLLRPNRTIHQKN